MYYFGITLRVKATVFMKVISTKLQKSHFFQEKTNDRFGIKDD